MIGLQALHESGCLRGKARPLSMAASLMMGSFTTTQSLSWMRKPFDKHKHVHKNTRTGLKITHKKPKIAAGHSLCCLMYPLDSHIL